MRRVTLQQPSIPEHRHAVSHDERLLLIVGDNDEGDADLVLQALQFHLHGAAQLLVERAERLVEQQQTWPLDQRAGQSDALFLAADNRSGSRPASVASCVVSDDCVDAAAEFGRRQVLHLKAVEMLALRAQREERIGLEHQIDRPLVGRDFCDVAPVEQDAPVARRLESPRAPGHVVLPQPDAPSSAKLVLADAERHAVDRTDCTEALADRVDLEQRPRLAHAGTSPRLRRCDNVSAVMLTAMTMVASALISGVTPKRIIA